MELLLQRLNRLISKPNFSVFIAFLFRLFAGLAYLVTAPIIMSFGPMEDIIKNVLLPNGKDFQSINARQDIQSRFGTRLLFSALRLLLWSKEKLTRYLYRLLAHSIAYGVRVGRGTSTLEVLRQDFRTYRLENTYSALSLQIEILRGLSLVLDSKPLQRDTVPKSTAI